MVEDPYESRRLTEGHPDIAKKSVSHFAAGLEAIGDDPSRLQRWLRCLDRLVDMSPPKRILVIGTGARPNTVRYLLECGHQALGVEPDDGFREEGNRFLGRSDVVLPGSAEHLPVEDASQDIVFCENVLEHVDSPRISVEEMYRVAKPGAVAMVYTTNRHRFNMRGENGEFNLPFFNWFPPLLKEAFIFEHLHHRPDLANYASRPAVHWFSYTDLVRLGRDAGFAQFYGIPDVMSASDPDIRASAVRSAILKRVQRSPLLRALAMSQLGHLIFMVKRR